MSRIETTRGKAGVVEGVRFIIYTYICTCIYIYMQIYTYYGLLTIAHSHGDKASLDPKPVASSLGICKADPGKALCWVQRGLGKKARGGGGVGVFRGLKV